MPPASAKDPEQEQTNKSKRDEQARSLCLRILNAIGRPENFFRISAVRLWENYYRVNVQTGSDAVSTQIAHSYFVNTDEKGNVVESTPRITKLY